MDRQLHVLAAAAELRNFPRSEIDHAAGDDHSAFYLRSLLSFRQRQDMKIVDRFALVSTQRSKKSRPSDGAASVLRGTRTAIARRRPAGRPAVGVGSVRGASSLRYTGLPVSAPACVPADPPG
jgi:hypothetical protein